MDLKKLKLEKFRNLRLRLDGDHFYFMLLGELYRGIDPEKAQLQLEKAFGLAKTGTERKAIQTKIASLC